jgi:hypothetical protein
MRSSEKSLDKMALSKLSQIDVLLLRMSLHIPALHVSFSFFSFSADHFYYSVSSGSTIIIFL